MGPLRKIVEIVRFSDSPYEPSRVLLECGHEARSWGTYRARCKQCAKELAVEL